MSEPTEKDLIYIAGFFDGEGCVAIKKGKPGGGNLSIRYGLLVTVANTNLPVIEYIQSMLDGVIYIAKSNTNRLHPRAKPCYSLYWSAARGAKMLELLIPYLRVKKQEAELGVSFQNIVDASPGYGNPHISLTQLELDVREVFYQASKKLKESISKGGN